MSLKVREGSWDRRQSVNEQITETLAHELSLKYPEMFNGKSVAAEDWTMMEALIRTAVMEAKEIPVMDKEHIVKKLIGQATGYGPLRPFFLGGEAGGVMGFISDDKVKEITEVMGVPSSDGKLKVFYGMHGQTFYAGDHFFADNDEVHRFVRKLCEDAGRSFNQNVPIQDAWLRDESRLAVYGFRANPFGIGFTIRKSPLTRPPLLLPDLVRLQMMPMLAADMMTDLFVDGHANLGFFGRTDSGKTNLMRACGQYINPIERVFIGETSFELAFPHLPNCTNLVEVTNMGKMIIAMTDICNAFNRNNPDRVLIGEIRSKEVQAASQAAASTSQGFWTGGHAGDWNDLVNRFHGMFYEAGINLSLEFIKQKIESMFHFVIFLDKSTRRLEPDDRSKIETKRTLMSIVELTEKGPRTIIKFDVNEFIRTNGEVRRWIYENTITKDRLSLLAFRGGIIKPEYKDKNVVGEYLN